LKNQEECSNAADFTVNSESCPGCKVNFGQKERLKGRKNIQVVFSHGRKFYCQGAKLFIIGNNLTYNRICFTFTRGFGNAVKRNRARRLSRESYRFLLPRLLGGYDLILLQFPEEKASLADRTKQLEFLLSKAGLLQ
jgi:ribonuclease P protein component